MLFKVITDFEFNGNVIREGEMIVLNTPVKEGVVCPIIYGSDYPSVFSYDEEPICIPTGGGTALIPKIFHFFWTGQDFRLFDYLSVFTAKRHNPDFKICLWYDEKPVDNEWWDRAVDCCSTVEKVSDILELNVPGATYNKRSDYTRYYMLHEYGGVYLDTDLFVLRSFAPLLSNEFFTGYQHPRNSKEGGKIAVGAMGSTRSNRFIGSVLEEAKECVEGPYGRMGPLLMTNMIESNVTEKVTVYDPVVFYSIAPVTNRVFNVLGKVHEYMYVFHYWNGLHRKRLGTFDILKNKDLLFYSALETAIGVDNIKSIF